MDGVASREEPGRIVATTHGTTAVIRPYSSSHGNDRIWGGSLAEAIDRASPLGRPLKRRVPRRGPCNIRYWSRDPGGGQRMGIPGREAKATLHPHINIERSGETPLQPQCGRKRELLPRSRSGEEDQHTSGWDGIMFTRSDYQFVPIRCCIAAALMLCCYCLPKTCGRG